MSLTDCYKLFQQDLCTYVGDKLQRACCHQLVNSLLRADDIRLPETTCWPHQPSLL